MPENSDPEEAVVVINKPRLLALLSFEVLGILLMGWAALEVYHFGNNPVHGKDLVVIASLILTTSSVWFSKIYDGPGVLGLYRTE